MRVKMICFDMDGTIADLYAVNGWEPMLRAEDTTPYEAAEPMWDMAELAEVLMMLQMAQIEIRVITWLGKQSTEDFKERSRTAKREWLERYGLPIDHFHGVQYGATKADSVRRYLAEDETAILVDDNAKVRAGWNVGETIDPTAVNLIEVLRSLL